MGEIALKDKKILVAEDDEMNRELMSDILQSMNLPVEFARDGNEAVHKFKQGKFDLILMDIRMPNKDGISATKEIRLLEPPGQRIPILALTASILEEEKQTCIEAGLDDFIYKPISLQILRNKITKYLQENK